MTPLGLALTLVEAGVLSVDAEGRVWRHSVKVRGKQKPLAPRRAENVAGKGYLRVTLQMPDGATRSVMAHRLVHEVRIGPVPHDRQINHKDLNKQNNAPGNLEIVSGAENIRHSYEHGRAMPWSTGRSKRWRGERALLTEAQKAEANSLRSSGAALKDIAIKLGISVSHAHRVTTGKQHA